MTNPLQAGVDHAELRRLVEAAIELGAIVEAEGEPAWYDEGAATMGGRLPPEDASYIAAAKPAVMVALLNEIDALRAAPVLPDRGWRPGDAVFYDMGEGVKLRATYRGDCEGWPLITFDADNGSDAPQPVRPSRLTPRALPDAPAEGAE